MRFKKAAVLDAKRSNTGSQIGAKKTYYSRRRQNNKTLYSNRTQAKPSCATA